MNEKNTGKNIAVAVLSIALVCVCVYAYTLYKDRGGYRTQSENSAESAFLQLKYTASSLSEELGVCAVSSDKNNIMRTLLSVSRLSAEAGAGLSALAMSQNVTSDAVDFYTQTADYTAALLLKLAEGSELSDNDRSDLAAMSQCAQALSDGFGSFWENRDDESFAWESISTPYLAEDIAADTYAGIFGDFGTYRESYPELSYDGKYTAKGEFVAKGLTGDDENYEDIAAGIKDKISGGDGIELDYTGETGADIAGYGFTLTQGEDTYDLTYAQKGGVLISAGSSKVPANAEISKEEALKKAEEFLSDLGVTDTQATDWQIYNNTAMFDFAYTRDGVIYYPDKLSVQVSLEDGGIIGYEAADYYTNHYQRAEFTPLLSVEQARQRLSDSLTVTAVNEAVVLSAAGAEVSCYEFNVQLEGKTYVILIDAAVGDELAVYRKAEDENGVYIF